MDMIVLLSGVLAYIISTDRATSRLTPPLIQTPSMKRMIARQDCLCSLSAYRLHVHCRHADGAGVSIGWRQDSRCLIDLLTRRWNRNIIPEPRPPLSCCTCHQKRTNRVNSTSIFLGIVHAHCILKQCQHHVLVIKKPLKMSERTTQKRCPRIGKIPEDLKERIHYVFAMRDCAKNLYAFLGARKNASRGPVRPARISLTMAGEERKSNDSNCFSLRSRTHNVDASSSFSCFSMPWMNSSL